MSNNLYKIQFLANKKIYELYVKKINTHEMVGFVVLEDFVFGEKTDIVIDPNEDKLRSEFQDVKRSFIPFHHVLRIDEVKSHGQSKIKKYDGKEQSSVMPFPNFPNN